MARLAPWTSVTAEFCAVEITCSSATNASCAVAPLALEDATGSRTASFIPCARPELRPPFRYAAPSATYLTMNLVRRLLLGCCAARITPAPEFAPVVEGVGAELGCRRHSLAIREPGALGAACSRLDRAETAMGSTVRVIVVPVIAS